VRFTPERDEQVLLSIKIFATLQVILGSIKILKGIVVFHKRVVFKCSLKDQRILRIKRLPVIYLYLMKVIQIKFYFSIL